MPAAQRVATLDDTMTRKLKLLIVEDEDAIRAGLADVFVYHGYEVEAVARGDEGLRLALRGGYDLLLLDVMLPGVDGYTLCNRVREADREQPIVMLTARTADEDIIQGLTLGADDYVAKPFSVAELVLRVQAVLRRSRAAVRMEQVIRLGEEVEVDVPNLAGRRGATPLAFTRREMDLLLYLHAHPEHAVSREELLVKVWGHARNAEVETRTVDIHVAKLRRKLEPDPAAPRYLLTVRGAGYRLCPDASA